MTDSSTALTVLTYKQTTQSLRQLADRGRIDVEDVAHPRRLGTRGLPSTTVFVCFVSDIDEDAIRHLKQFASSIKKYLLVSKRGRVEAIAERVTRLNIRNPGRLHIASVEEDESIESMWKRLLSVLSAAPSDHRILDAWWEDDELVVISQHFERLRLSLDQFRGIRFFANSSMEELERFEIDEDGSFIRWPQPDVDLDWNGICRLAGKTDARREARLRQFRTEYGAAIRKLREQRGLRQRDTEGLDERHVRRIEKGEISATTSALKKLADSHEMSVQEYLDELARLVETD